MQISEIKRPALIEPFFNLEIDFKNDYVEYIPTTNQNAVTPRSNNIENSLISKKFITCASTKKAFEEIKQVNKFREIYLTQFHNFNVLSTISLERLGYWNARKRFIA